MLLSYLEPRVLNNVQSSSVLCNVFTHKFLETFSFYGFPKDFKVSFSFFCQLNLDFFGSENRDLSL